MRWKTKDNSQPKLGDIRERLKMAWLPTKVGKYTVWLERYWIKEQLMDVAGWEEGVVVANRCWVEIERVPADYYI